MELSKADSADLVMNRLKESPLFVQCRPIDLASLAEASHLQSLAKGATLMKEGDHAQDMMILLEGQATVFKRVDHAGHDHVIATMGAGDSIGEMALLDDGPRSATVIASTDLTVLVMPIEKLRALAKERPEFSASLLEMAGGLVARLRQANSSTVQNLQRALDEEKDRSILGRFTFMLIVTYSLYTWILGTAAQLKESMGRSEFITVPAIIIITAILAWFMRSSGYGPAFFGLNLQRWRRQVMESVALTAVLMVLSLGLKWLLIEYVDAMKGQPLIQMLGGGSMQTPAAQFKPWLTLAYVVFAPFQELIYRGALQGSLSHFLTGQKRQWQAILGSNIIFSAAHLYISPGLSITAFFAGLFWGWLYARQKSLLGVSLSHILLGFWAFEVVDLGVLE